MRKRARVHCPGQDRSNKSCATSHRENCGSVSPALLWHSAGMPVCAAPMKKPNSVSATFSPLTSARSQLLRRPSKTLYFVVSLRAGRKRERETLVAVALTDVHEALVDHHDRVHPDIRHRVEAPGVPADNRSPRPRLWLCQNAVGTAVLTTPGSRT